jgi:hypothetical protein
MNEGYSLQGCQKNSKKWVDRDCATPLDPYIRNMYFKTKKSLCKLCRHKNKLFKVSILNRLQELDNRDPKEFWKILSKKKAQTSHLDNTPSSDD